MLIRDKRQADRPYQNHHYPAAQAVRGLGHLRLGPKRHNRSMRRGGKGRLLSFISRASLTEGIGRAASVSHDEAFHLLIDRPGRGKAARGSHRKILFRVIEWSQSVGLTRQFLPVARSVSLQMVKPTAWSRGASAGAFLRAIDMRGLIFFIVLAGGAVWAFDAYEYDGRHVDAAWQQARAEGQHFSREVRRRVDSILSGN